MMISLVTLLVLIAGGSLTAMDEQYPLLAQSVKSEIKHKIIEHIQYTTEVPDFDAVEFDEENLSYLLFGTQQGLLLYDTKNHKKGTSKQIPSFPIVSIRSGQDKNNKNLIIFSTGNSIGVCSHKKINAVTTQGTQSNPSRVRSLSKTKMAAFQKNTINLYDPQLLCKGILGTITNDKPVEGVVAYAEDQLIEWDNTAIRFWDIRQSLAKPLHTSTLQAYSVAPNGARIAIGTKGKIAILDKRQLKEPIWSKMLKPNKIVGVAYNKPNEFVAAYGDQVSTIDVEKPTIKSTYDVQSNDQWEQKPNWVGCKVANEIVVLNWLALCDQEKSSGIKQVVSIVNLQKASDVNDEK